MQHLLFISAAGRRAGRVFQRLARALLVFALVSALVVTSPGGAPEPAAAAPADNFSLSKSDSVGGEALIGEEVTYTLSASGSQSSGNYLYNLSFRDVLPAGIGFLSADPPPTAVLADVPSTGETTVIWENVTDLPANSQASVSVTVDTNPDFAGGFSGAATVPVGSTVINNGEAVASLDAFNIPDWDLVTGAFTGDFDGSASATSTMEIIPFRVTKTADSELLRGVHANGFDGASGTTGTLYTIEVEINPDYDVNNVGVTDTLAPAVEFLGCDTYPAWVDHTSVGEEWLGSGPVATGIGCGPTPDSVTNNTTAETVVTWALGNRGAGTTWTGTYQAGIALYENEPFNDAGYDPTTRTQGRNLDNNTGPSTGEPDRTLNPDPELLSAPEQLADNTVVANGIYTPNSSSHTDDQIFRAESEDLVLSKSMAGSLVQGQIVTTMLTINTSEYRDFSDLVVRDLMPSALCFLGTYNVDNSPSNDWRATDCAGAGSISSTINGTPVDVSAVRELPDGGPYGTGRFELVWDFADTPALTDLDADGTLTITYSAVVRDFYRGGYAQLPGEPVLAGDTATNSAEVSGPDIVADPVLPADQVDPDATTPGTGIDGDTAEAGLENALPSLNKRISVKTGPLADGAGATAATCGADHGSITWSEADPGPELGYGPGDIVCFELNADFPIDVNYEGVLIRDLLPTGYVYQTGSATRITPTDNLDLTTVTESAQEVEFIVDGSGDVSSGGHRFQSVIAAELADPFAGAANDINANLQKMIHNNNGGLVYQLRDLTPAVWTEPEVRLAKGVETVNGAGSNGPDLDGSLTGGSTPVIVERGDVVTYRIDVWNEGNVDAALTDVRDVLPAGLDCGDVTLVSPPAGPGVGCSGSTITWDDLTVPLSTGLGDAVPDDETTAPITLEYDVAIPLDVDPNQVYTNVAQVDRYQAATNNAAAAKDPYIYRPGINTEDASDPAYVETPRVTISKRQRSGVDEAGNAANASLASAADEATIGEIIQYQITATVPEETTVYDAVIRDTLPAGLSWFTGNASFGGSVADLQPIITSSTGSTGLTGGIVTHSGGVVSYALPATYNNPDDSGEANPGDDEVTITFYAQVDDIVDNEADPTPTRFRNRGRIIWDDASGASRPVVRSNRVDSFVVEPNPAIDKIHTAPAGSAVLPGDTVTYQITVTNDASAASNVSVAHDVTVVDDVPSDLTPLGVGGVPVANDGDPVVSLGVAPAGPFFGTWSETNRTITWTPIDWPAGLDAIDPDGSTQFTYQAQVNDPAVSSGVLTNTADLTAYSLDQADPNAADARIYTDDDSETVTVPVAALTKDIEPFNPLDANDDRATYTIGEPVDYQVTVDVPDGTVAYDATVFDQLPAALDFDTFGPLTISPECEVFDAGTGSTTGTSLPAGDVETFNPVNGDASLAAWFLGDVYSDGGCTITAEYTAHVNDTGADTDTVTNGASLTWNDSDQVTDQAPASLPAGYDDPASPNWTVAEGPETETFTIVEPALQIDKDVADVGGVALASPACDTTPGNNHAGNDDADGDPANGCDTTAGSVLRYTVTVTSAGTAPAHDVTLVDAVPDGLTPLDAPGGTPVSTTGDAVVGSTGSSGVWDETAHTITWTIAGPYLFSLTETLDYDAPVDPSNELSRGQELTNAVDVPTYFGLPAAERTQIVADNPANDDLVTYGSAPSATRGPVTIDEVTVEVHFPELAVDKAPAAGQDVTDVRLDQSFQWIITITNTDTVASAFNVDATDVLPDGWTYDAGSALVVTPYTGIPVVVDPTCSAAPIGSCGQAGVLNVETLTWDDLVSGSGEPLGPGEQILVSITATPRSAALTSTQVIGESFTGYDAGAGFAHTNDVDVVGEDATGSTTCCDPDGPGPGLPEGYTDDDSDDVFIARADIELDKAITPVDADSNPVNGPYWFGSWVDYTITVDNVGPDEATAVEVSDVLDPSELAFDSVVGSSQGSFDDTTNLWDVGTVASGATATLTIRARLVGLGTVTNTAQNSAADQYDSDSTPANDESNEDDHDTVTIEVVPTSLGDFVWLDLNGDGVQDAGEPGIPGVELVLTWLDPFDGSLETYTTTTGADGAYGVPPSVGLPSNTDITVTVNASASPNLDGLAPSFERDGALDGSAIDQITGADSTLPSGALADLDFDFGFTPDGTQTLGDKVWWDQDASGTDTNGVGEYGLPGVTVTATWAGYDNIVGTADDIDFTQDTDANGDYLFTDLPPGLYEVTVDSSDLPAGLTSATYDLDGTGTAHTADLALTPGENQLDVDFSYTGVEQLGDTVWFDHDGDGVQDANEPGLGGVTVTATWDGPDGIPGTTDDVVLIDLTEPDGTYLFENLPQGDYVVAVDPATLPGGLVPTFDDDGIVTPHTSTVTLDGSPPDDLDQDFGYRGAGSIGDTVFFDVDGTEADGVPDLGDAPIAGVDITVVWAGADGTFGTADDFTFTDTTNAAGAYLVSDLPHGDYTVTVDTADLPPGLDSQTYDDDGTTTAHSSTTTLTALVPDDLDQDFAYTGMGTGRIGDTVWFDHDADGVLDAGEVGFSGVTVTLVWYGPDGLPFTGDEVAQTTVTDADGMYLFDNLPEGTFEVLVDGTTLPGGLSPTHDDDGIGTVNSSVTTLTAAAPEDLDQDFGFAGIGSLGDLVWFDIDNSGTAAPDPGEPGLAGVDVTVVWTNPQGADVTLVVTTDADGMYLVPNLPYGDYEVTVDPATLPGFLVPTFDADSIFSPHTSDTTLSVAQPDDLTQDFAYTGDGSLGDTVWFDQDADGAADPLGSGVFDGQDQPLAGVTIDVLWGGFDLTIGDDPATPGVDESADDLWYTATTDANGEWLLPNLPYGPYEVHVDTTTLPPGIDVATFDFDGVGTADTSLTAIDATTPVDLDQDFSYTGAGSVGDTVWFDLDGDGEIDVHEVPLAGVGVTLEYAGPNGTTVTITTVTDADGMYLFENLPFDTVLTVTVDDTTLPPGFVPTFDDDGTDTANQSVTTLTAAAPDDLDQDFGYNGLGSIGDTVWFDRDRSQTPIVDPGEPGIPNVAVTVTWANPTGAADLVVTLITDADGQYLLPGLPHGDYTVTVDPITLPGGLEPSWDADGVLTPHEADTVLDATTPDDLGLDFAYAGTGSIGDTVWSDDDADGVLDAGEVPLAGVTVTLMYIDPITGLEFTDTTTTADDGTYEFTLLPAGDYTVTVDPATLPIGFSPTHDLDGTDTPDSAVVVLGPGEDRPDVDFGYRPEADLALNKSHVGDFAIGSDHTWTLTVTNNGPADARVPVVVTDTLPLGVTPTSAEGDEWNCTVIGQDLTCTYVDAATGDPIVMANGTTSSIDVVVDVDRAAAPGVVNTALVTSPTPVDPAPDNNESVDPVDVPLAELDIEKTMDSTLVAGEYATYVLTVTNRGPSATRGDVTVVDDLPSGLLFVSADSDQSAAACSAASGVVTCTNPVSMAVGDTWVITIVADVRSAPGTVVANGATVSGGNEVNGTPLPPELGGDEDVLTVTAAAPTSAGPSGPLAFTGASTIQLVMAALVMLLAGLLLWGASRPARRRSRD